MLNPFANSPSRAIFDETTLYDTSQSNRDQRASQAAGATAGAGYVRAAENKAAYDQEIMDKQLAFQERLQQNTFEFEAEQARLNREMQERVASRSGGSGGLGGFLSSVVPSVISAF